MSSTAAFLAGVEVLVFDVFGTVADWRKNIVKQLTEIGKKYSISQSPLRLVPGRLQLSFQNRWIGKPLQMNGGADTWCIRAFDRHALDARAVGLTRIPYRKRISENGDGPTNTDELHRQVRGAYIHVPGFRSIFCLAPGRLDRFSPVSVGTPWSTLG